jgi:hypothetical protein
MHRKREKKTQDSATVKIIKERERERESKTLDMDSAAGVPRRSVMRSSWWTTFLPGNSGFPLSISANMQPMLHISIAGVYCKRKEKN